MTADAYGAFAYAYDRALGERFFKALRGLLDESVRTHCSPRRTHLDAACGTGLVLEHMTGSGWRSTGLDASVPMLRVAEARAPRARLVAGDLRALPFRRTFSLVTCVYDSLNHLMERSDLAAAFRSVRSVMDDDSVFLFDMNHPDVYPEVWGLSEPFFANGQDWELEIGTTYRKRERLGRATIRGWAIVGGEKVEITEQHRQRAYSERDINASLGEAGLEPVEVFDFDPYQEGGATVKLFYVCRAKRA